MKRYLTLALALLLLCISTEVMAQGQAAGTVNVRNLLNTAGSTTSGQSGVMMLGAVTTGDPSYTTAQSNFFSLGLDGTLRVNCRVGCTSAVGTTIFNGQASVTTSAAALASNTAKQVCLKSAIANTDLIYIGVTGVTTGTGYQVNPGDGQCLAINNSNLIFAISASGTQTLTFNGWN